MAMNIFKKLFGKNKKSFPSPTQRIPGIEPIVVHATEQIFLNVQDQKSAFAYIRGQNSPKLQLALLYYSEGNIEKLRKASAQSHPHFWMDDIAPIFSTMEDAEEWVKSLSKSQAEQEG